MFVYLIIRRLHILTLPSDMYFLKVAMLPHIDGKTDFFAEGRLFFGGGLDILEIKNPPNPARTVGLFPLFSTF